MRCGEFLLSAEKSQAHRDTLLRIFETHIGIAPKRNQPCRSHAAGCGRWTVFWVTFHEVGHAAFDMFNVPIFGHEEDAADNFATFIMLQFGKGQAPRLINGAAWAWRAYLGDYQKNPVVPTRLAAFASDHGLPQERFHNLVCLAFGANSQEFADF